MRRDGAERDQSREEWADQVELSHFVNAYYQLRDLRLCAARGKVLLIGPGQGLSPVVLRWKRYQVTTLDVDVVLRPNVLGSVHELGMFRDGEFDVAIVSHVLEHVKPALVEECVQGIARVSRFALIYLPVTGLYAQLRVRANYHDVDQSIVLGLKRPFSRVNPSEARFMGGQHFWEVGLPGFRVRDLRRQLGRHFQILSAYRNRDWLPSYNFVLKSRAE